MYRKDAYCLGQRNGNLALWETGLGNCTSVFQSWLYLAGLGKPFKLSGFSFCIHKTSCLG